MQNMRSGLGLQITLTQNCVCFFLCFKFLSESQASYMATVQCDWPNLTVTLCALMSNLLWHCQISLGQSNQATTLQILISLKLTVDPSKSQSKMCPLFKISKVRVRKISFLSNTHIAQYAYKLGRPKYNPPDNGSLSTMWRTRFRDARGMQMTSSQELPSFIYVFTL